MRRKAKGPSSRRRAKHARPKRYKRALKLLRRYARGEAP